MHYTYIAENAEQYDSSRFTEGQPVHARYRHADNDFDAGNPFIEALPLPRQGVDTLHAYTKYVNGLKPTANNSFAKNLQEISLLRQLRFALPFHQELEDNCYMAMVESYRARHIMKDNGVNLKITQNNERRNVNQILIGNVAAGTNAGFHMLGWSGCGKSSALEILFSNYPQYIVHEMPDGTRFPQITYLVVTCQPNSNFKALYESIGMAIDRALGNITPVYEYEISKGGGLAGKAELVRRYIELFAVGIIVFDEIQLIDFESTKENSFEGLMTLANQTKVAMAVVGTEDAYERMFTKLRTSRRLGIEINASSYCEDKNYFALLVHQLLRYQWFDKQLEVTNELVDALYTYSAGIIDQLIGIYMYMNIDYVNASSKPIVDAEYVKKTAEKHYPGIQSVLADMANPLNDKKRADIVRTANMEMDRAMDKANQER